MYIACWLWLGLGLLFATPVPAEGQADPFSEPVPTPQTSADYRFSSDVYGALLQAAEDKPGVVSVEEIGVTVNGRPIHAWHVAEPGVLIERKVLVFAGIHALEWISTEVATTLLLELIALPPRGTQVTVIPILNPDGRRRVEADLIAGRNRYQRGNANFTDLNRDFSVHREAKAIWRHIIPGYYSNTGDMGLTAPESRALDALAAREKYDRAASLHAFGGFLYHPWSGDWNRPEDHAAYVVLGRSMEQAQGDHAYRTRQLSRWGFFFRAQGTEIDHLYGTYGTQAFLVEMTRSGWDPRHPIASAKSYFRWYNPVNPQRHIERGVSAMRALIRTDIQPDADPA